MTISITIQNLDEPTATWIHKEAKQRDVNIETLILQLIHKAVSLEQKEEPLKRYHDLDWLAGSWSEEEYNEFMQNTADFRRIDTEIYHVEK